MKNLARMLFFPMLLVPSLVFAWTAGITVQGPAGGMDVNKVTVNTTPPTVVNGGTVFVFPASTVNSLTASVAVKDGYSAAVTLNNGGLQTFYPPGSTYIIPKAVSVQNLKVVYTVSTRNITVTQSNGGLVSITIGNSTTTTGFTNVGINTAVVVTASPNSSYKVTGITVNGSTTSYDSSSAVTKPFNVSSGFSPNTVTATFASTPIITSSLSAPVTAISGDPITVTASASTNMDPTHLRYAFGVTGPNSFSQIQAASAANTFTFTPPTAGSYTVTLTTTTTDGGTDGGKTAVITVTDKLTSENNLCISCHGNSSPQIVADYINSVHPGKQIGCQNCHSSVPHGGDGVNARTVDAATFSTLEPNVFGLAKGANFCANGTCHSTAIVSEFAASPHYTPAGANSCSFCHVQGVHNVNASCVDCHTPGVLPWPPPQFGFHIAYTGTNQCVNCHNLHNPAIITGVPYPHFSNFSTAQFVTLNISCVNCHNYSLQGVFNLLPENFQFSKSGKANPKSPAYIGPGPYTEAGLEAFDFKSLGTPLPAKPATSTGKDCVRCHTTTGYINYVTPTIPGDLATSFSNIQAWGTAGDRTREMVACSACHNNTAIFDATYSRRSVGFQTNPNNEGVYNVMAWYGYSSAATKKFVRAKEYDNSVGSMNDSNICIACHAGTSVGDVIKLNSTCTTKPSIACRVGETGVFWGAVDFIDPHGMGGANLMFDVVKSGYEFGSGTSSRSPSHTNVGMDNNSTQGPCVGCHMSSPNKHSFSAISTATTRVITGITTPLCGTCHGISAMPLDASILEGKKEGYQAALAVITDQLAVKGIHYDAAVPPYFFTVSNPAQHTFANRVVNWNFSSSFQGANLMGAAFNLRLLQSDKGGYVHSSTYVKRLLYDTISYLDDHSPKSVISAIQGAAVDAATKTAAMSYIGTRP